MLNKSDLLAIKTLVDTANEELKEELLTNYDSLKNRVALFEDKMVGRLDKIDQDLLLLTGDKDQLEDHETRISKLEKRKLTQ